MPNSSRGSFLVAVLLGVTVPLANAELPRTDLHGEPMPAAALVRFGRVPQKEPGSRLTFSPDGKLLAEAKPASVCLWNVANGQLVRTLDNPSPRHGLESMTFTPDAQNLMAAYIDAGGHSQQYDWNLATGKSHLRFEFSAHAVELSPDGRLLAVACTVQWKEKDRRYGVILWDVTTGKPLREITRDCLTHNLRFSTDGKVLSALVSGAVPRRWDVATGEELQNETAAAPKEGTVLLSRDGKTSAPYMRPLEKQLAFSDDGKIFASGDNEGTIHLRDTANGTTLHRLREEHHWYGPAAFSRDGKLFSCATHDRPPRVWDLATGKQLPQFGGHLRPVFYVAFSPDGKTIASISEARNAIRLWDAATGRQRLVIEEAGVPLRFPVFSPDGKSLAAAYGRTAINVWDVATGQRLCQLPGHNTWVAAIGFLPDGRLVSAGADRKVHPGNWRTVPFAQLRMDISDLTGTIRLWDAASGKQLGLREGISIGANATTRSQGVFFDPDRNGPVDCGLYSAFAPDGKTFTSITLEGGSWSSGNLTDFLSGGKRMLRAWDVETGKLRTVVTITLEGGPSKVVDATDFLRGGGDVKVNSTIRANLRFEMDAKGLCPSFTSDGKTFVLSGDRSLTLWDTATGQQRQNVAWPHKEPFRAVLSPDSTSLAVATFEKEYANGVVRLYDLKKNKEFGKIPCDRANYWPLALASVVFSPDGAKLATGNGDGTILIWDFAALRAGVK